MTQPWTTIRQVVAVNEDKAVLVGGYLADRIGNVTVGMYHVLYSNGREKFVSSPVEL